MCGIAEALSIMSIVNLGIGMVGKNAEINAYNQSAKATAKAQAEQMALQLGQIEADREQNRFRKEQTVRDARRKTAETAGKLRLLSGASGVEVDSGSALDVLLNTSMQGAEDIFSIEQQAAFTEKNLLNRKKQVEINSKQNRSYTPQRMTLLDGGQAVSKITGSMGAFI